MVMQRGSIESEAMGKVEIEIVFPVQPEPPDPENCRWLEAGGDPKRAAASAVAASH